MEYYDSAAIYVNTSTDLCDKITNIEAVQAALLVAAMNAADNDHIQEYSLNDGQTIIRTEYRGVDAIMKSYNAWERIKQQFINQLNGRVFKMVDGKSINNGRNGSR